MVGLQEQWEAEFQARMASFESRRPHQRALRDALFPSLSENTALQAAVQSARSARQAAADRRVEPPAQRPARERIFTGSLAATRVPPYWWASSWMRTLGLNQGFETTAKGTVAGNLDLDGEAHGDDPCAASARAWVGTFVSPPTEVGNLSIWSLPAINYFGQDWTWFADGATYGWIGLFVQEYDINGVPSGAPIAQKIELWGDHSWYTPSGEIDLPGSNSGFPLSAQLQVDNDHSYGLFVWCGVDVYGEGDGLYSFGGARGQLSVHVPSITWELV